MADEDKYFNKAEFIKAYNNISLSFALINITNEYLKRHHKDTDDIDEIIKVLDCIKEKLQIVYIDFINKNIV